MRHSFRVTTLASAIGIATISLGALPYADADSTTNSSAHGVSVQRSNMQETYIVRFSEAGLLYYDGGIAQIPATAPASTNHRKLDARSTAAQTYAAYLAHQRSAHVEAISRALGRSLSVTHSYAITQNGIAAIMTAAEADLVARLSDIASVRVSRKYVLNTFRGPEFIGAESIWNGSGSPVPSRGQGVVVADVDTGIASTHPSFSDDETCGFGAANHKLLSAVDCGTTDVSGLCNGLNPEADDGNGHGVHTAGTAVGNTLDSTASPPPRIPPPHTSMSGVAPCAHLRSYKVCPITGCTDAAVTAGIENAIADQVDVINFSLGPDCGSHPGESPWTNGDEIWLDALNADIFVAAAAGNTRAACPDPTGRVSNIGPWITTVAASTHDENVSGNGLMSAAGPGTPPANTQNISMTPGSGVDQGVSMSGVEIRFDADNDIGCTANGGFPPGFFDGTVALISRGTCTFEEKVTNAQAAGAVLAIVYNNTSGDLSMDVGAAALPAYGISQTDGQAVVAFVASNGASPTTINFTPAVQQGDVLAGFSFRGPNALTSVTKPDLTAPGVTIYAALDDADGSYGALSGTSMSSPHTAGAGALLRSVHPEWTPSEMKSALMLTAATGGTQEDGTTSWTPDDVGAGRIDLAKAARAGFVMDETYANYLAADPATGGDPTTLNLASMRNLDGCETASPCNWTRTLRDTLPGASSWTVTVNSPTGLLVGVSPSSFTFRGTGNAPDTVFRNGFEVTAGPETQRIVVTAAIDQALAGAQFAEVVFHETNGLAPDAHMYVAVQGSTTSGGPFGVSCEDGECSFQIDTGDDQVNAVGCDVYCGLVWLNRFTPDAADFPITITSISTLFVSQPGWNAAGDHINFYVYQDADVFPYNGATLVGSHQGYTMPEPSNTFETIVLDTPIVVNGPGDVLIAMTNPAPNIGSRPASSDGGPYANRSWWALYSDAGVAPDLSAVGLLPSNTIPFFEGNWLIRASGINAAGRPIALGIPKKQ